MQLAAFISLAHALGADLSHIVVCGEVDNPGTLEIKEGETLAQLLSSKVSLSPVAAQRRIDITRDGRTVAYDLKSDGDIELKHGDMIKIPISQYYEGQKNDQHQLVELKTLNPAEAFERIKALKVEGAKVQYVTAHRIEFRSAEQEPEHHFSRVQVLLQDGQNEAGELLAPKIAISILNWSPKIGPTRIRNYQQEIKRRIMEICATENTEGVDEGTQAKISLSPFEIADESAPPLQEAFPRRVEIVRDVLARGDYKLIHYTVRIYSDLADKDELSLCDFAWVIASAENEVIAMSKLPAAFPATRPPDRREYLTFSFAVHASQENFTTINVGRNTTMRTYYKSYRLPMKSIELPTESP